MSWGAGVRRGDAHPDDDRLAARYFGDDLPEIDRHVGVCHRCAARQGVMQAELDAERARLGRSTDAYFTPSRLSAQRAEILARLAAPRRARVLAFPAAGEAATLRPASAPGRVRWVTAAVAAVMLAATGAGWLAEEGRRWTRHGASSFLAERLGAAHDAALHEPDDEALAAIDVALARPGASELLALDALTLQPRLDRR
jgi:hypothetical protein